MDKMIGIINDNLRSVIGGIRTHREDTEKNLATLKNEIDEKIAIASGYKDEVENARTIISTLENEISELENDLLELNSKFGSKNFKEILSAGNKEINTQIAEKRSLISEQSDRILELTDKAHLLREELVKLRDRKSATESNLEKTLTLEKYYGKRINNIIDFSEENPYELDSFIDDVPQDELIVNSEDIDITNVIDGSIFAEIDEISTGKEVDENLIKEALAKNELEEETTIEEVEAEKPKKETIIDPDLSMTQQLDDIISEANDLLKKSEQIKENIVDNDTTDEDASGGAHIYVPTPSVNKELPSTSEINMSVSNHLDEEPLDLDKIVSPYSNKEEKNQVEDTNINEDEEDISSFLDELKKYNAGDEDEAIELKIENDEEEKTPGVEDFVKETVITEDANIIESSIFNNTPANFLDAMSEMELDTNRFSSEDLEKLENGFNLPNTQEIISVMHKHSITTDCLYDAVNVLLEVTPQNLDQMLTLLEKAEATPEAIQYVFKYLDKVNLNRLEESVEVNKNAELTEILYEAMPYIEESDLITVLGFNIEEENALRKNTSIDEFKMMNMFPTIVETNYNTLKALNINNLNECITKHPHRFLSNPDRFNAILDKYDTEDLVRCIQKNAAVIDKL